MKKMKKMLVGLTIAAALSMIVATPAFAEGVAKGHDNENTGRARAARLHCCNPGQDGPANAQEVFETNFDISHIW